MKNLQEKKNWKKLQSNFAEHLQGWNEFEEKSCKNKNCLSKTIIIWNNLLIVSIREKKLIVEGFIMATMTFIKNPRSKPKLTGFIQK